jgi:carboxypeptidase C (cathepsin A)
VWFDVAWCATQAKNASLLFWESPAGVGFSYCTSVGGVPEKCGPYNDTVAGDAMRFFAVSFV